MQFKTISIVAVLEHDLIVLILLRINFFFYSIQLFFRGVGPRHLDQKSVDQVAHTMRGNVYCLSVFGKCYFQTYSKATLFLQENMRKTPG
jgi:hypothetical protein